MDWLIKAIKMTGFKTYIAGIGMIALGVYQITEGNYDAGMKMVMEGLAVFGIRAAIEKV